MKASRFLLPLLLLSVIAVADTLPDPRILIIPGGGSTPLTSLNFDFNLSGPSSPCTETSVTPVPTWDCAFVNVSGVPWTSLKLVISPAQAPLNCTAEPYFAQCTADPEGGLSVLFFNGSIPNSDSEEQDLAHFVLEFEGFQSDTGIAGQANVPEPGTLLLLSSGIAGLIARRKRAS